MKKKEKRKKFQKKKGEIKDLDRIIKLSGRIEKTAQKRKNIIRGRLRKL